MEVRINPAPFRGVLAIRKGLRKLAFSIPAWQSQPLAADRDYEHHVLGRCSRILLHGCMHKILTHDMIKIVALIQKGIFMVRKKTAGTKFGEYTSELFELFSKADRKKMEAAIKSQDFTRICDALGVTENELKELLLKGAKLVQGMFDNSLKEAVAAFKKTSKA